MICKAKYLLVVVWISLLGGKVQSQILQNPDDFERIRKGVIHIYNCEFDEAQEVERYLESKYPNKPATYLFQGMLVYWENYPLLPGTPTGEKFEEDLQKGVELAAEKLKNNESDAENLLYALGSSGLLLLYYADNDESGKVISLAPRTYTWVRHAFNYTRQYKDFYFITGLYNYYREAYASAHPVYKPLMFFFPKGSKKLGLKELRIAADSSIFLNAEAYLFLSDIYQNYERNPVEALQYSRRLMNSYENNYQFRIQYIRDLLVIKKYGEAESLLNGIPYGSANKFLQAQVDIFKGVIQEKRYNNRRQAEELYWTGISKAEAYGSVAAQFSAYGYFGLSRIYNERGDNKAARLYRKRAKELSDFDYLNFDQ